MTDWPASGIAVGVDIQPVADVLEALTGRGQRYLDRVYTAQEQRDCGVGREAAEAIAERLSGRFAAKEAFLKAVRVGADPPGFLDVEIVAHPSGAPSLRLYGAADESARRAGITGLSISISHAAGLAMAIVVAT